MAHGSETQLSEADVAKLLSNPSPEIRAETAGRIAQQFDVQNLSTAEIQIAEDIFRLMMRDAETLVRQALSENLKDNPALPRDVATSLAADVECVALPVIQFSEVLQDEDLIALVRTQGEVKQTAIAKRAQVSEEIADALVAEGHENVVATLVANDGAEVSPQTFQKVLNDHGQSELVHEGMINRSKLPLSISEQLVTVVSEKLKSRLVVKHELPNNIATDLLLQSRERATLLMSEGYSDEELEALVASMHRNGRLTPSIILRALCVGDVAFFEAALIELSNVSRENAKRVIRDGGMRGVEGLYRKTGLSDVYFPLIKVALDVDFENEYDGMENDRERYMRRTIERIMTQFEELGVEIESDDLDYLMGKVVDLPGAVIEAQ